MFCNTDKRRSLYPINLLCPIVKITFKNFNALLLGNVQLITVCCCCCLVTKLCLTLCNPKECSPPVSSVHGISQARILEWVAVSSREYSWTGEKTCISCIGRQILYHWATWEAFSSQTGFLMLWPERSIQSESQTLGTKFNSRWEKINKQRDFQDSSPAEPPRMIHWKSAFYFSWWLWCLGKLNNYGWRSSQGNLWWRKGLRGKIKGSQALCKDHRYTMLGLLLQWRSPYQMFYLVKSRQTACFLICTGLWVKCTPLW